MMKTETGDHKDKTAAWEKRFGKDVLPLSKFENDYFIGTSPIEVFFLYKKNNAIMKMKESLLKTIEHYNLYSSRLIMMDENKFALQYCTDGTVANPLPPVDATFDSMNIDDLTKRMYHVQTLPGEPLFAVTGIPLKDGIFAGISMSHAVGDGISILLFLYAWMCISDGKDFLRPSGQRLFKGTPIKSDQIDKSLIPPLSELRKGIQNQVNNVNPIKTYTKNEYFSDVFLNNIKQRAKADHVKYEISNHQIMTAHLLKKYSDHILPNTDKIILRSPINLRDVHPDIDPMYIGSANFNSFTEFTKDEIHQLSILEIACRMKESMMVMRSESYARKTAYLSDYGVEIDTEVLKNEHPPYSIETNIVSSNMTHLNDLESMFVGPETGSVLGIGLVIQTGFTMLKEKSGRIVAQITSRYPFT